MDYTRGNHKEKSPLWIWIDLDKIIIYFILNMIFLFLINKKYIIIWVFHLMNEPQYQLTFN